MFNSLRTEILAASIAAVFAACAALPAKAADAKSVARLIDLAEPGLQDSSRWAKAILRALKKNRIEQSRENICAAIAVIDQESNFEANPKVPGLGRIAAKAFRKKVDESNALTLMFAAFPGLRAQLEQDIAAAKTERDLDMATRHAFDQIRANWTVGPLITLLEAFVSESGMFEYMNEVKTIGSMQVSIAFARQAKLKPESEEIEETYGLRDYLYTVEGGVDLGVLQLLGYSTPYSFKIHRFADYNAGRYASRNAAFQKIVGQLSGEAIALDGDLLLYGKNAEPSSSASHTQSLIGKVAAENGLALSNLDIKRDLRKEKTRAFETTATFKRVRALFRNNTQADAPMAVIPEIKLHSLKLSQGWTTRRFAEKVSGRYKACMKLWRI